MIFSRCIQKLKANGYDHKESCDDGNSSSDDCNSSSHDGNSSEEEDDDQSYADFVKKNHGRSNGNISSIDEQACSNHLCCL